MAASEWMFLKQKYEFYHRNISMIVKNSISYFFLKLNYIMEIFRWLYKTLFLHSSLKLKHLCKQNRKRLTFCSYMSQKVHTVNRVTLFHFSPFYFDSYVICVKDLVSGLYGGHWPFIKTCYLLLLCLIFNIITAIFVRRSKSPESLVTVTRQDQFHCYVSYHNGKFLKITDQV